MSTKRPRSNPKPLPFVATGAIVGFIVFGVISWIGPNRNEGFDITYDPSAAPGLHERPRSAAGRPRRRGRGRAAHLPQVEAPLLRISLRSCAPGCARP
uniref:Uncharacterized protein n=1 Tax=Janibacter limosus TaxID=53458 RepID=A0AC61U528_9MICO|nr:hypothetical protein [Janibacter limosus]